MNMFGLTTKFLRQQLRTTSLVHPMYLFKDKSLEIDIYSLVLQVTGPYLNYIHETLFFLHWIFKIIINMLGSIKNDEKERYF